MKSLVDFRRMTPRQLPNVVGECWEWTGNRDKDGYAKISLTKSLRVSRIMYSLCKGPVHGQNMFVCHSCDNPVCCNPDHLFLGTAKVNKQDAVNKGRHSKGETIGNSRLTDSTVRELRHRYMSGERNMCDLSRKTGIPRTTIRQAVFGIRWGHVQEPPPCPMP